MNIRRSMLARLDDHGNLLSASSAAERVLGRSPRELVGVALDSLLAPEDAPRLREALQEALAADDAVSLTCRLAELAAGERSLALSLHAVRTGDAAELHCVAEVAAPSDPALAERLAATERRVQQYELMLDEVPCVVWASWGSDTGKEQASYINTAITALSGYSREDWTTRPMFWFELIHPDDKPQVQAGTSTLMTTGFIVNEYRWVRKDGGVVWVEARVRLLRDAAGNTIGMAGSTVDITAKKEAEVAERRARDEMLAAQERALADLSTPMIPLGERVVAMPLVGTLDRARATRVLDALLHGVSSSGARVAIIDITGVPAVDTQIAETLVRAARGVRLLGAQVILTGIRPEVAQTFVSLGIELGDIVTLRNLEAGIQFATAARR